MAFFESHSFHLPPWAKWSPADWTRKGSECDEIRHNQLGWDVTDFSSGDFEKEGLTLVTLRNGNAKRDRKVYCEKIMMVRVGQVTPTHFHWKKMEDIINRGGGNVLIRGEKLHIDRLSVENETMAVSGTISAVIYSEKSGPKKGFFAKLFK